MVQSKVMWAFYGMAIGLLLACPAFSQVSGKDSVLPPDHLLENLPWMGDDGKIESKGLFDFEDVRGIGHKDLILIYRPSSVSDSIRPTPKLSPCVFMNSAQKKICKEF